MARESTDTIEQLDATHVRWQGKRFVYFGGCDYLRLSWHPRIRRAVSNGVQRDGLNVGASRMTTGNHPVYAATEKKLEKFFAAPSVSLVSSGYLTNLVVAHGCRGMVDNVLIDESVHPSLLDAARLLDVKVGSFRHLDAGDLRRKINRVRGRVMVMTDGVFAHDGSLAPLSDYRASLPDDGILLADDAHGVGVLGGTGRGSLEHWGIGYDRVIQTATFSKAFGVYGGAVLGSRELRNRITSAGAFVGSTPLPPNIVTGIGTAVGVVKVGGARRRRLDRNCRLVASVSGLEFAGFPVFTVVPRNPRQRRQVVRRLTAAGIHPPFIRYPGGIDTGFFRFAIASEHSRRQLEDLSEVLRGVCD
jgi:8-amino-7-oxononanoate synthase